MELRIRDKSKYRYIRVKKEEEKKPKKMTVTGMSRERDAKKKKSSKFIYIAVHINKRWSAQSETVTSERGGKEGGGGKDDRTGRGGGWGGEESKHKTPPPPRPARLSPAPPGCSARCPLLGVPLPVARLWHRTCLGGTKQSLPAAAPCCPPAPPPPCSLPRSPSAALIRPTLIWVCFFSPRVGRVVPVCSLAVIFFSPLSTFFVALNFLIVARFVRKC